mmetsp:Transcript_31046/g.88017  ORF Transcript_31046/g.88017 Transcript_31046/m.88017 type:complete len:112 (-) Transcript_31046:1257-1592(-)
MCAVKLTWLMRLEHIAGRGRRLQVQAGPHSCTKFPIRESMCKMGPAAPACLPKWNHNWANNQLDLGKGSKKIQRTGTQSSSHHRSAEEPADVHLRHRDPYSSSSSQALCML